MTERYRCSLWEHTGRYRSYWAQIANGACPAKPERGYHMAAIDLGEVDKRLGDWPPADDPIWREPCACGFVFPVSDAPGAKHGGSKSIWREVATGREITDLPPGALYYDPNDRRSRNGPDGKSLVCVTPGGHWYIDSRSSNCTRKDDDAHRCWVRRGVPPDVHVDKGSGGNETCAAGAGSIICGGWHGFLHHGELYRC